MKAIYYKAYGGPEVLTLRDIPIPKPSKDQLLIKVHAASINSADWRIMRANPAMIRLIFGIFRPRPKNRFLGTDFSGTVEAVGSEVLGYKAGDEVLGNLHVKQGGSFAQYVACSESKLTKKPTKVDFAQAACLPLAAQTALEAFKDLLPDGTDKINKNYKILVNGASGGVGLLTMQMAVLTGAHVTAVCSTKHMELIKSFGNPDVLIDYKNQSIPKEKYNRVISVNGTLTLMEYKDLLTDDGKFFLIGSSTNALYFETMLKGKSIFKKGQQSLKIIDGLVNKKDLGYLVGLLENKQLKVHIDRTCPLAQTQEAMRHFEEVHPSGKLLILPNA